MKKYITLLLTFLIVFSLVACTENQNNQSSLIEAYKAKATEYIEQGDKETAIEVLEEGITATNDEQLKQMLEEFKKGEDEESTVDSQGDGSEISTESSDESIVIPTFDISHYTGCWYENEDVACGYESGLEIIISENRNLNLTPTIVFEICDEYSASTTLICTANDIVNNKITTSFVDDSYNTGMICIEFLDNGDIKCSIWDVKGAMVAWSSIREGEYILTYRMEFQM